MKTWQLAGSIAAGLIVIASACESTAVRRNQPAARGGGADTATAVLGSKTHEAKVMQSVFCAECHPAMYAEHEQNTHGRAFSDEEVRLATGRFDHGDCIRCHTPRPIFETGIGLNPIRRYHNLEEGNTCMTCHWRQGFDYSRFTGGIECKTAFDDRVGEVEACASCHRNHGTPYQWEVAPTGKAAGKTCMSCHMPLVRRPVAVGEKPRSVRSHGFPGARSESQLRRAYSYRTRIDGDHVVVEIENDGAGHHFPTELKQRSLESLIVVRDTDGQEVSRSRMVFRDPYKRPYGLELPVNTQIRPGTTAVHRVPLKVAEGTVDCELHFKHYFPIEDHHPDLARMLEDEQLEFSGVTPSDEEVVSAPGASYTTPDGISAEASSPANLVDYQKDLVIGHVDIPIPTGDSQADIATLVSLFQFPVPEGNRKAQARLVEIGLPAVPALIEALGSWDNKTFKQASKVLGKIGAPAVPALLDALSNRQLYIRHHARGILANTDPGRFRDADASTDAAMRERVVATLRTACEGDNALDRRSALETATSLLLHELRPLASRLLDDRDPDVVVAAAECLARNAHVGVAESDVERIEQAMRDAFYPETRRALAVTLAELGNANGIPVLLAGLDIDDDLVREDFFESLFQVTGVHEGYLPMGQRKERLAAMARLQGWWAKEGGVEALRAIDPVPPSLDNTAWHLVGSLANGKADDAATSAALVEMGSTAVPALVRGLKYPPGFADRRALICSTLRSIGSNDAAPALSAALDDPVLAVAAWACFALQSCGDPACVPALERYRGRLHTLHARGKIPAELDFATLLQQCDATLALYR